MIERRNKIYIWNELHSIVVVKYKHSSISGTLNCDISSLENGTEMVDHSMNPEFSGTSYELYVTLFLIKARIFFLFFHSI